MINKDIIKILKKKRKKEEVDIISDYEMEYGNEDNWIQKKYRDIILGENKMEE